MPSKRRRGRRGRRRRTNPARIVLTMALAVVILVGVFVGLHKYEQSRYHTNRGETSEYFYEDTRIEVDGVEYKSKRDLTSILLEGVSGSEDSGRKVEMLILFLLDHKQQEIRWMQLDPDTALASGGVLRDALPSEGDEKEQAKALMATVEDLLGAKIELYVSLDLDRIGVLNRALNGIDLAVGADYSAYDAAMTAGATLTLSDAQAELYMNPSIQLAGDTCTARMQRQQQFMLAALNALEREARKDTGVLNRFYEELSACSTKRQRPTITKSVSLSFCPGRKAFRRTAKSASSPMRRRFRHGCLRCFTTGNSERGESALRDYRRTAWQERRKRRRRWSIPIRTCGRPLNAKTMKFRLI